MANVNALSGTEAPLERIEVRDWMISNKMVQTNQAVGENENGYPFVTFIDVNNVAHNIYFSKKAALSVALGTPIIKGFFAVFVIVETKNAKGEERTKLATRGESVRMDIDDLF